MNKKRIAIVGGIAVGKSTLLHLLSKRLPEYPCIEEDVSKNIFLPDFYNDMKRWAFHSRISTLSMIVDNILQVDSAKYGFIIDRCVDELITFAKMHYDRGNMTEREFSVYRTLYNSFLNLIPPIDYFIFCQCSVEVSLQRIKIRGREFERGVHAAYITELNRYYNEWINSVDNNRVIRFNTESNFSETDVNALVSQYSL